jgi:hypothetical protein
MGTTSHAHHDQTTFRHLAPARPRSRFARGRSESEKPIGRHARISSIAGAQALAFRTAASLLSWSAKRGHASEISGDRPRHTRLFVLA